MHMKPIRIKSIDIFRGLCMSWMILGHLLDWWLKEEKSVLRSIMTKILEPIGASGFLFVSGISVMLSFKKRLSKIGNSDEFSYRMIRNSYFFRALLLFIIAIIYNSAVAIRLMDPSMIWTWFVLLTIAVSLILVWPFLTTSKLFRILFCVIIIILNQFLISLLLPFEGDSNIYGFLFHFLYNDIHQDPILTFFPFFLFGTVVGEIIFEITYVNENKNKYAFKRKFLFPLIPFGSILILFGILFEFPRFLNRASFSWIIYSLGFELVLLSLLLTFEQLILINTKKSYKLLFYYSYYSLTIYLGHNLLYFLFLHQLNTFNILFFIGAIFVLIGLILRATYQKWEDSASLKVQIGKLSIFLMKEIEKRLNKKT